MGKVKKAPPPIVRFAILLGDKDALSRLGRAGASRKKEIAALDRERKVRIQLAFAEEMSLQANEDICPVD